MLIWLMIWFWVKEIYATDSQNGPWNSRKIGIRLKYYEITTMSLVAAFYWNTV